MPVGPKSKYSGSNPVTTRPLASRIPGLLILAGLVIPVISLLFCLATAIPPGRLVAQDTPPTENTPVESYPDSITVSGQKIKCRLLDKDNDLVVVQTSEGKRFLPAGTVQLIERNPNKKALQVFEKYEGKAKTATDWQKLINFCKKNDLTPEYRHSLREILKLEPENSGARMGLGQARYQGKWLSEKDTEEKLQSGYVIAKTDLVRKDPPSVPAGRTKVEKKDEEPSSIRIIESTKLSKTEARKIEEERKESRENAKKYRRNLERERIPRAWNEFKTKNFIVQCNSTPDVTRKYAAIMEIIREQLSKMFKSRVLRRTRAPVKIYASQNDFLRNDRYGMWGGRGLGGYYMPSNQSITTYHGTFGFTGTTFSVLAHEGTHYYEGLVLKGGFDNLPIWLIEGLAVYFGDGSKFHPDRKKIEIGLIPRDRLSHLQEKMLIKRHTSIQDLVALTRTSGFSGSHYADAWGLIYFLVNHPSKDGKKLLQKYWAAGMERQLTVFDFVKLVEHYFKSMEEMEKQYVAYILGLKSPPAGTIKGDFFLCDTFQFEFKSPGDPWQFFRDDKDKSLLIGMLKPNSSAQIRLYYENNRNNQKSDVYFKNYLRVANYFENLQHEKVKIGGLDGYKLTYTDSKKKSPFARQIEIIRLGRGGVILPPGGGNDPGKKKSDEDEKKKETPKEIVKFMLIQVDGIASIECSVEKAELEEFKDLFNTVNSNFSLILSRRW